MTQPNLLTRAKTALYAWRNGLGMPRTKASPYAWPAWRDKQPLWQLIDYDAYVGEGFNRNTLVYSAIIYKFMAMTQAPMRAYTGTRENPELLPETHPLAKLLARPNSHQSWVEYHGLSVVYMNLHGNAYTFMDKPPGSRGRLPDALVPLRPDRVYIVPANEGGRASLLGYIYVPEGRSAWEQYSQSERARRIQNGDVALIPADQMIHVKLPNPGDPLEGMGYGLSPLAAAGQSVDVDNAITSFIKTFFQRGGVPPFWFTFDVPLDDNTLADLRQYIGEQYGGFDNWTRPGVLDQGGKIERLGMSFDEMGFDGLDARNETRILSALGVTPILLGARIGLERSTMANYQEARRQFWEDRMLSESRLFEVEYQYYLRDGDAFPMFDMTEVPALQRNVPELADAAYKLWTMGVPAQSALATAGLEVEDLPAGDVGFVPIGVQPIGRSIEPPKPVPPQSQQPGQQGPRSPRQQGESEEGAASVEDEEPPKKGRGPAERAGLTDAAKDLTWKRVDQIAQSWEARFADMARRQFEIDERELLALMHKAQVTALERKATVDWAMIEQDAMYYLAQAGERWRSAFIPLLQGVVTEQANAWNVQYGMAFDVRNLFALRWWDEYTLKFAQPIMDTTKADIANVLRLAMDEGWSIPRMQNNLETLFQQWMTGDLTAEQFAWFEQRLPPYRTEMISRTETIRASSAGTEALYRAWNVQYKEWLTALDERTCFPAWTLVLTESGERPIQQIQPGEAVWTRRGWCRVSNVSSRNYGGTMRSIWTGGRKLTATADHPVWTSKQGWLEIGHLNVGDAVQLVGNQPSDVNRVSDFVLGHSNNMPAISRQIPVLAGIPGWVSMPIGPVNLKRNTGIRQHKVNRVFANLHFLMEGNADCAKRKPNVTLNTSLARILSIAGKRTETAVVGWSRAKSLSAVSTVNKLRRAIAFFRAVVSIPIGICKYLSAAFTRNVLSICSSALSTAYGESIRNDRRHLKGLAADRTDLTDHYGGAGRPSTFKRAVLAIRLAIAEVERLTTVGARPLGACTRGGVIARTRAVCPAVLPLRARECLAALVTNIIKRHIYHLLSEIAVLYHRLSGNATVFDLTVDGAHEFYANGVLVHNCPWCSEMNGKVLATGDKWFSKGDTFTVGEGENAQVLKLGFEDISRPPLHPNCRCTLIPVVDEPGELRAGQATVGEPMIVGEPQGMPVSLALDMSNIPSGRSQIGRNVRAAIDIIDDVHGDGNLPSVQMRISNSRNLNGEYVYYVNTGRPAEISISKNTDHPRMTTAHEIGHFLDNQGLGIPGKSLIDTDEARPVLDAIRNSDAMQSIRDLHNVKEVDVEIDVGAGGTLTVKQAVDDRFLQYAARNDEAFARAYSQYIATKSGDTEMLAELADATRNVVSSRQTALSQGFKYPLQWAPDDFVPIANAFDVLFRGLGWLR